MKQFLLFTILFLSCFSLQAQSLRIVKDNLNCSYGIKDEAGDWVLDPIYVLIQPYNTGYFLVKDIGGDGVLEPNGKWLIECKYDRIYTTNGNWYVNPNSMGGNVSQRNKWNTFFRCVKGASQDLISRQGIKITSMSTDANIVFDDTEHLMVYESNPETSTYLDTTGKILIEEMPGVISPFQGRDYTLHGEGQGSYNSGRVYDNVRLINRTGEQILEGKFDKGMIISGGRICFIRDSCYGVMYTNGRIIIPPRFKRRIALNAPDLETEGWVIIDEDQKSGIMLNDGKVLIEPKYDNIYPIHVNGRDKKAWTIEENGKFGVINTSGEWLVPLSYDRIIPYFVLRNVKRDLQLSFILEKENKWGYLNPESDSVPRKFYDSILPISSYHYSFKTSLGRAFITKENGKYGILDRYGSVHSACTYDAHLARSSSNEYQFFYRGNVLKEFVFGYDKIEERPWKPFLADEEEIVFMNRDTYVTAILEKGKDQIKSLRMGMDHTLNQRYGNMFVPNRGSDGSLRIFNHLTSKRIDLRNIGQIIPLAEDRFSVITKSYHRGLVDGSGNIILDTIYNSVELDRNSTRIWVAKETGQWSFKWMLLDSVGRQVLPNLFDTRFKLNSGDQIVTQNGRIGLMDTKSLKWKIQPEHPCLYKSVDDFYNVLSVKGKQGIIRSNGTYLLRPIYDSVILFTANSYAGGSLQGGVEPEFHWLVRLGTNEVIINQDGHEITSRKGVEAFKQALLFGDTTLLKQPDQIGTFPVLDYTPSLHFLRGLSMEEIQRKRRALWKSASLKSAVFDTISKEWEARKTNCNPLHGVVYFTVDDAGTQKEQEEQKIANLCRCAQSGNQPYRSCTYVNLLRSIGKNFATVSKEYRSNNYGYNQWGNMGIQQYPVAAINQNWNFVVKDGKVASIQLEDIFPNDEVLMEEFIKALQKRDDLKLECSSVENMIEMINGKFSLSKYGIRLYLNQQTANIYGTSAQVELLIPIENLSSHEGSKWIVPILRQE